MASYLKDSLGVRVPITGTADHGHSSSSYPMLMSLSKLDIVDGHVYWQHPGSPPPVNTPMVNDPLRSTVVKLSRTAVAGKPYTVSEFNHPFPNEWASEGIPILAAYAAFQDWDAVMVYTFEPKRDPAWKGYVGDPFDISHDPVRMTQMAAGALTFLRGDVRPARQTVSRSYTRDQAFESRRLPRTEQPYFTPGFPLALPLVHGVRIRSLDGPPTQKLAALDTNVMVSDTRELTWTTTPRDKGLVREETDRTQALIGFVKANAKSVRNLSARHRQRLREHRADVDGSEADRERGEAAPHRWLARHEHGDEAESGPHADARSGRATVVDRASDGNDHAARAAWARHPRLGIGTRRGGEGDRCADRREANAGRLGAADRYARDHMVRRVGHAVGSRTIRLIVLGGRHVRAVS